MIALFFAILLGVSSIAQATDYYVAASGGDDSRSCATIQNIATPNATIRDVLLGCAVAGDTIYVRTGASYSENIGTIIPKGISNSQRTVIRSYNDEDVTVTLTNSAHGIYITSGTAGTTGNITLYGIDWRRPSGSGNLIKIEGSVSNNVTIANISIEGPRPADISSYKCKARDNLHDGINVQGPTSNIVVRRCEVYNNGLGATVAPYAHGSYFQRVTGLVIEENFYHDNGCYQFQVYPYTQGAHIVGNLIKDDGVTAACTSQINLANTGHLVERNIFWTTLTTTAYGLRVQYGDTAPSNLTIRQNIFYGQFGNAIYMANTSSNSLITNNIILNATSAITDLGTNNQKVTNTTSGTGTTYFNDPANGDFTHKAGSPAIGTATDYGLGCNGACDRGAFQTIKFASCQVPASATNTIQVTFTNNAAPPLSGSFTTFTARLNGANNALTGAVTRIGDNILSLPLTSSYVAGNTADISRSSGSLFDSSAVGGFMNQPFLGTLTNQSCTNNAAGAPASVLTQTKYIFHGVYGAEASPEIRSGENEASYTANRGGAFRIRFALVNSVADRAPEGVYLRYAQGGGYSLVPDTFDSGNVAFCGGTYTGNIPSNQTPTTQQLTMGTFAPGAVLLNAQATPTLTLANGTSTELEYCVKFDDDASGDYTFRLYSESGDPLQAYTVTPTVTAVPTRATGGH